MAEPDFSEITWIKSCQFSGKCGRGINFVNGYLIRTCSGQGFDSLSVDKQDSPVCLECLINLIEALANYDLRYNIEGSDEDGHQASLAGLSFTCKKTRISRASRVNSYLRSFRYDQEI